MEKSSRMFEIVPSFDQRSQWKVRQSSLSSCCWVPKIQYCLRPPEVGPTIDPFFHDQPTDLEDDYCWIWPVEVGFEGFV